MRVLICGSRDFNDYLKMKEVLDTCVITSIVHGGAKGADTLAGRYGDEISVPVEVFPAEWSTYGRSAGPIRNTRMLTEGLPEMVIAFRKPYSRGTQNMIDQATANGIETRIIDCD